jgi:transcriptional regulator with XRE-family HTH domain
MTEKGPGTGPTVLRMILGRQLQALREKAGLSYEQAAQAIYSSWYTVRRMERGEGGLKPLTVKSLLMAYGITDVREIDAFLALARDASKPGWWHSYDDVLPAWFKVAVGLEESASLIRAYEPQVIPGCCRPRTTSAPRPPPASPPRPVRRSSGGWRCGWPARKSCAAPRRRSTGW